MMGSVAEYWCRLAAVVGSNAIVAWNDHENARSFNLSLDEELRDLRLAAPAVRKHNNLKGS